MHGLYVIEETNMAIPLSVISKAQKGKNADHAISDKNLIALQYGMENAIAVIDNPARNSLAFITSLEEDGGQVAVFFDKNVQFDGDQVNKATSIHRRTNIVGLMNNLSENAIIYVKNKTNLTPLWGWPIQSRPLTRGKSNSLMKAYHRTVILSSVPIRILLRLKASSLRPTEIKRRCIPISMGRKLRRMFSRKSNAAPVSTRNTWMRPLPETKSFH